MFCCFCDNPAVEGRPGAPLCAQCWCRFERKAREATPATSEVFLNGKGLLVREAQRLASDPRGQHLAASSASPRSAARPRAPPFSKSLCVEKHRPIPENMGAPGMRRSQTICISGSLMHQQCDCDFGRAGGEIEPRLGSNRESFA
jgi:hypothetical protein